MKSAVLILLAVWIWPVGAIAQAPAVSGTQPAPAQPPYLTEPDLGLSFPISYKGEVLGDPTGGHRQGAVYDGLLEAGLTADLGKLTRQPGWQGATLTIDGLYPHGSSLTRNDVRDYNVLSNIDARHNPRLYEAWIEQDLDAGKFSIRAGQVPIDSEFFISTVGALFINSAFGVLPSISQNVNVAVYPVAAPGVRLRETPNSTWSVQGGVFDGNVGDLQSTNRNGLRFNLNGSDGAFMIGEVDFSPQAPAGPLKSGTCKLGGFYHTAQPDFQQAGQPRQCDYGFYFITDQNLWQPRDRKARACRHSGAWAPGPRIGARCSFTLTAALVTPACCRAIARIRWAWG